MKQRLTIIFTVIVIVGLLVIINVATYVKVSPHDLESAPNRSTYHAGPTGTRAIYDFLGESGYKVMRWREEPQQLLNASGQFVKTFVIIGKTQLPISAEEAYSLNHWVSEGGRLILIDRWPDESLMGDSSDWKIRTSGFTFPGADIDPANSSDMTEGAVALSPLQPTGLTRSVHSVMPSRFASRLEVKPTGSHEDGQPPEETETSLAPVTHLADARGALLVDFAYGKGRITLLSDPYLISNGGISLNDNLLLSLDLLTNVPGLIAFDEFHQARGVSRNAIASYFAGTPVLPIVAQIILITLVILWTRSRRFARALPLASVDRRSSLEFVASMAELQERSRSYDLAIENIYSRTRRALARYAGVDYNSPRSIVASRVAQRSGVQAEKVEQLMQRAEEIINGTEVGWKQSVELVRELRTLERTLGLLMRSRDIRQAASNI